MCPNPICLGREDEDHSLPSAHIIIRVLEASAEFGKFPKIWSLHLSPMCPAEEGKGHCWKGHCWELLTPKFMLSHWKVIWKNIGPKAYWIKAKIIRTKSQKEKWNMVTINIWSFFSYTSWLIMLLNFCNLGSISVY